MAHFFWHGRAMATDSTLTIRRPDDWHVHLRDGDVMRGVLPYTARQFARAIVMPNLAPPVTTLTWPSRFINSWTLAIWVSRKT